MSLSHKVSPAAIVRYITSSRHKFGILSTAPSTPTACKRISSNDSSTLAIEMIAATSRKFLTSLYMMTSNKYLTQLSYTKTPLEKEASVLGSVGIALGAHALQNTAGNIALRGKNILSNALGRSHLMNQFHAGLRGLPNQTTKKRAFLEGALFPDLGILGDGLHEAGKALKPHMDKLSLREKVLVKHLSTGDLKKFTSGYQRLPNSTNIDSLLHHASKETGLPLHRMSQIAKHADLSNPQHQEAMQIFHDHYRSKGSPITNNTLAHIAESRKTFVPVAKPTADHHIARHLGAVTTVAGGEPFAGAYNGIKTLLADPTVINQSVNLSHIHPSFKNEALQPLKKARSLFEEKFYRHPAAEAGRKALEEGYRRPTTIKEKLKHEGLVYGLNSTRMALVDSANEMGDALHKIKNHYGLG